MPISDRPNGSGTLVAWKNRSHFMINFQVAELASFKKMKESFAANGRGDFIRKGVVHDWKNHLTETMNRRIEEETYTRLRAVCPKLLKQWEDLGVLSGTA